MRPLRHSLHQRLRRNQDGIAAIEFALMAPLLMAVLLGVLEFGIYFTKYFTVQRAVATISLTVQSDPNNPDLQAMANNSSLSLVNFSQSPNYFCAQPYDSFANAQSGMCTSGFNTTAPANVAEDTPYYIALVGYVRQSPLTPAFGFLPDIRVSNVVRVTKLATASVLGRKVYSVMPTSGFTLNTSYQDVPYLNITYTPVSANSKIEVVFQFHVRALNSEATGNMTYCIYRNGAAPTDCQRYNTSVFGDTMVTARRIYDSVNTQPQVFGIRARAYTSGYIVRLHETRAGEGWVGPGYSFLVEPVVIVTEFIQAP